MGTLSPDRRDSSAIRISMSHLIPIRLARRINQVAAPEGFIAMRRRWDAFQLTRGSLQLLGFVLITIGLVAV